jgi:hypothetical protein
LQTHVYVTIAFKNGGRSSINFTVFHQFLGLINLLDDDDNNNLMLEIVRRRNYLLGRYLERQRVIQNRIHENREVYYSSYIGTWFASYPDRQFINDFRLSKQGFQVIQINEM